MDQQRKTVYGVRQEVLASQGLKEKVVAMMTNVVERMAGTFRGDAEGFRGWFQRCFGVDLDPESARVATGEEPDPAPAVEAAVRRYDEREKELGEELQRRIDRHLLLHSIDTKWMDHLRAIDALRHGIGLRGYAQRDPKNEYKAEGFELFQKLMAAIEDEIASLILRVRVQMQPPEHAGARPDGAALPGAAGFPPLATPLARRLATATPEQVRAAQQMMLARASTRRVPASAAFDAMRRASPPAAAAAPGTGAPAAPAPSSAPPAQPPARASAAGSAPPGPAPRPASESARGPAEPAPLPASALKSAGRNDPCPCGSGKKFKKCHGVGT
jgi:preprotein translocase subunit SecA